MRVKVAPFGSRWLRARLAALFPTFPNIAVCVAFSGGVDSTALLAALARGPRSRLQLRALHVHHGLHPNANAWSAHCQRFAKELGVQLKVIAIEVQRQRGASLEAQARDARYAALAGELHAGEILLTAHHADDQLETVFLQLLRGAGLPGIAAMPEVARFATGVLARPLLMRTRGELAEWVYKRALISIEDTSNADERLDRNYLRRQVLPRIRSRWPACAIAVSRSAGHAAQAQRMLEGIGRTDVDKAADGMALSAQALRGLPLERRKNALRVWIADGGWPAPDTRRLAELAGPLLQARPDANPAVAWNQVIVRREADRVSAHAAADAANTRHEIRWKWRAAPLQRLPGDLGELALEADKRGPIDLDLLPPELYVRWRSGGERLRPRTAGRTRTLKGLLQESHLAPSDRARLPLLYAGTRLIAVADLWADASIHAQPRSPRRARILWRHA